MRPICHGFINCHNVYGNAVKVKGKATFNARVENGIFFSYDTPIARKELKRVYVDMDYYSPTTTRQRNALILYCKENGLQVIELHGTKLLV